MDGLQKLLVAVKERHNYKDNLISDCYQRLEHVTADELQGAKAVYHSQCYKHITNISKVRRLKERYEKRQLTDEDDINTSENIDNNGISADISRIETKTLRSKSLSYVYQDDLDKLLEITRSSGKDFKFTEKQTIKQEVCFKPTPPNETFQNFERPTSLIDLNLIRNKDRVWALLQVADDDSICTLPTWTAFNSLLTKPPLITTCQSLPLYPGHPTDWGNLYTALKIVQGINVSVAGNRKTIVTLDFQLYAKCMQLRVKKDVYDNYIFRLGELHIVFAFLKAMGKYIAGSGLDRVLTESGIYGPTTLGQIIDGKHMKRCMEAHMILYLSLNKLYLKGALEKHPHFLEEISTARNKIFSGISDEYDGEHLKMIYDDSIADITESGIVTTLEEYDQSLSQQPLFLRNYMVMYEALLLFVRSSREGNWALHLSSLDNMVKYFFAHDQINYARLTPLYLATMTDLLSNDIESWNYLEESFAISKSQIPFTSIGSDHALEQENKVMKVTGGVKGLTQNPSGLHRFCLTAPVLNALSQEFCSNNGIAVQSRIHHYQFTGSANSRVALNVQKLLDVYDTFGVSFEENEFVMNIVSKAVLPVEIATKLLQHERIGEELYQSFINERLIGSESVWSPLKKCKLPTFKNQGKKVTMTVEKKLVQLKEERTLLSRFLITARKRPEIDLEESIGNYEFTVVPHSMFTDDGQPLLSTDKAKLLHEIESLVTEEPLADVEYMDQNTKSVIIIDGMALVNRVHKDSDMKTWKVNLSTMKAMRKVATCVNDDLPFVQ